MEDGVPAGGSFITTDRSGATTVAQSCSWTRYVNDAQKVYLGCGENTRGIGPGAGAFETGFSAEVAVDGTPESISGVDATCHEIVDERRDGSVCISNDANVPVRIVVVSAPGRDATGSFSAWSVTPGATLTLPVITTIFDGETTKERLGLP
jgi:hypothetical protein